MILNIFGRKNKSDKKDEQSETAVSSESEGKATAESENIQIPENELSSKEKPEETGTSAPFSTSDNEQNAAEMPGEEKIVVEESVSDDISDGKKKKKKKKKKKSKKNKAARKKGKRASWLKRVFGLAILDRYILKKFLGTYFLATILFLAVIAMFDITEKLDAFLTAPLKETLFDYFASFLPYFANQLSPLFVFISVIFFTTKMAANSEIIAILSSGISFRRLLRPYMIGAAVIAALTFALSNYIIPPTNVKRIAYTNKYVKNKEVKSGADIQMMVKPGVVAYIGRFDGPSKTGYRFSLDEFNGKELVSRMTAQRIVYDTTTNYKWTAHEYMIRRFSGTKEKITNGMMLDTIIPIEPKDILISVNDQETLTTPQLQTYINKQRNRGVANITAFEIEKERRIATTAAAFILTLIGMSLSSKKVKGGMGVNIGIGLVLSFSYILFSTVTSSFAISGLTTPFIAMEIPNVVYLLIAIFLYLRASRR